MKDHQEDNLEEEEHKTQDRDTKNEIAGLD